MSALPEFQPQPAKLMVKRDGLPNVIAKLQAGGEVRVAYFGGSITAQGAGPSGKRRGMGRCS